MCLRLLLSWWQPSISNTNPGSRTFLAIKKHKLCQATPFSYLIYSLVRKLMYVKHPENSNCFLAHRWRNHSVKRLRVVLWEVKMCFKVWFWRLMHLFVLSLSTLSMPGGNKIRYSSDLYTVNTYLSNPYLPCKRGVCFWVNRNILKIQGLWFASLIFAHLWGKVISCLGANKSGKRRVDREEKQCLAFIIIGLKKTNKPSWDRYLRNPWIYTLK